MPLGTPKKTETLVDKLYFGHNTTIMNKTAKNIIKYRGWSMNPELTAHTFFTTLLFAAVLALGVFSLSACATPPEEPEPPPILAQSIAFPGSSVALTPAGERSFPVSILPSNAVVEVITYKTDNPEYIRIDQQGLVTGFNPGTTRIHAQMGELTAQAYAYVPRVLTAKDLEIRLIMVPDFANENKDAFWLQDTPVTYGLWERVYRWATTDRGDGRREDGGPLYFIPSIGRKGNDGAQAKSNEHPVTRISWRSALVWMNALTEYYNYRQNTALQPVYYTDNTMTTPMRNVNRDEVIRRDVFYSQDNPHVNSQADGFRLPYDEE